MPREVVIYQGKRWKLALSFPWFLLIGGWASLLIMSLAMTLTLTIIGIPRAFALIDQIPAIALRKEARSRGTTNESIPRRLLRAGYFLFIGCWLSTFWIVVALFINYTIILVGDRIAGRMIDYVPTIATLANISYSFPKRKSELISCITTKKGGRTTRARGECFHATELSSPHQ
jgi:uncharacterized membrane protein YccF (DUF307 family)